MYKRHRERIGGVTSKRVMTSHKQLLSTKTPEQKRFLNELAMGYQGEKRDQTRQRKHKLVEEARVCQDKLKARSNGGTIMRVGMCRFSGADETNFDALFKSGHFTTERLQELRSGACAEPPIEGDLELLVSMKIRGPQQPPPAKMATQAV